MIAYAKEHVKTAFESILESVGANQNVIGITRNGGHTLDLGLTFRIVLENIDVFSQSDFSDYYLISLKILHLSYTICTLHLYPPLP